MPTYAQPTFTKTKALSFDIYGTLIDWESGILPTLHPLTSQLPPTHPAHPSSPTYLGSAIAAFAAHEVAFIKPAAYIDYGELLARAYKGLAKEWGLPASDADADAVAASVADWKAFPDTVAAMQKLGGKYKLIALSNISRALFAKTKEGPLRDVEFDAVYTAEEIGSYKPDLKNFEFLVDGVRRDLGVEKEALVHVAHGVRSDQGPAEEVGIEHVWIRRGTDRMSFGGEGGMVERQRTWETLGDMADELVG
ncbi:MAG: hypothetical protein MMC23_006622 [Stictis urceolatum]|nr:hypothetical protein [Stictis urceolata]